jgi:ionotropic glutamate receptor
MSIMAEREEVVDFTVPFYDLVGISILMKKPKEDTALFGFLTALDLEVWAITICTYFLTRYC